MRLVGENRAQDLVAKHERYGDAFTWDFIGHLQSRKTKLVLPLVRLIHSVVVMSVVEEIQTRAAEPRAACCSRSTSVARRASAASSPARSIAFLEVAAGCDKVEFAGLMCMPPLSDDPAAAAPYFARTREMAERLSAQWSGRYTFAELSMGTSADYEVAVAEGATIIRVGSVLF